MTDWLEFHDSTLTGFNARETHVELLLDAYIHRWKRLDDGWRGTGWMQSVRIAVSNAIGPSAVPLLPVEISDGQLQLDTAAPNDVVRLPLQASGVIRIWLELTTADVVELTGSAIRIEATADARYIEELPPAARSRLTTAALLGDGCPEPARTTKRSHVTEPGCATDLHHGAAIGSVPSTCSCCGVASTPHTRSRTNLTPY